MHNMNVKKKQKKSLPDTNIYARLDENHKPRETAQYYVLN